MIEFLKYIGIYPWIRHVIYWSKSTSIPGLSGIPVYNIIRFIIIEFQKDDIYTRANSVAFSFFLSIFPSIIFLFTLLPLLPFTSGYQEIINSSVYEILPQEAAAYIMDIVNDMLSIKREGLLSAGFLLALFFASSGMLTLMYGFDKSYDSTFKSRGYFKKRLVAVALTLLLGTVLIMSIIFIILGKPLLSLAIETIGLSGYYSNILIVSKWVLTILMIYCIITLIYRYGPSMYRRIELFNTGAYLATSLSILSSVGFAYFVDNFGKYNEIYGSIGALIVLMVWIQINAFIILAGFELNASIAVNKDLLMQKNQSEDEDL